MRLTRVPSSVPPGDSRVTNGIVVALMAYAVYAWGDGFIKALGPSLSVFEIGFYNILFAAIVLVIFTPRGETWRGFWRMRQPWTVHARAWSGLIGGVLSVYAFTSIPLAEVYALIFLAPFFVTLLSIVVLKEKVGPWRWAAVFTGFGGVLLVVRPGFRELETGHFAALGVAVLAGFSVILMRSLAGERQTTVLGVLGVYGLVFNGVAAAATAPSLTLPDWPVLGLLVAAGICTGFGNRLQLLATRLSPVNVIAPTHYSQILWAVVIGAAFFAEYPDWLSLVGLAIVVGSGLLTLARERIRLGTVRWLGRNRL